MAATKTAPQRVRINSIQRLANYVARGSLATPGLARLVGAKLMVVYAVGRKSGRVYSIPVAYTQHEGTLVIGTPFGWAKNLRTGEPVTIRHKGKKLQADVQAFTNEEDVTRLYAVMCRANGQFAMFNKIRMDSGVPNPSDLHDAWAAGSRAFRLTPRR